MFDIEDFILYGIAAGFSACISSGLEFMGHNKAAKTVDVVFFGGSAILIIKQLDGITKEVLEFL